MEKYILARSVDEVRAYIKDAKVVSFDFETAPNEKYRNDNMAAIDAHKSHIVGVSFSAEEGTGIYAPIAHKNTNLNLDMHDLLKEFSESTAVKIAHNLAFEAMFLYANNILIKPPVYDTILAAMMTLKSKTEFRDLSDSGLKTIVPQLLHIDLPKFSEVTDGRHFDELNPEDYETIRYACADSDYALQLYNLINTWFDKYLPRHRWIIENIESPTAIFVGIMKYNGVSIDKALMYQKQFDAGERIIKIYSEIKKFIGKEIDIGANASTDALKKYLYEDLQLPILKTTSKYQAATDEESLMLLKDWCNDNKPEVLPLLNLIHEYRKKISVLQERLKNSAEQIRSWINENAHREMNQAVYETEYQERTERYKKVEEEVSDLERERALMQNKYKEACNALNILKETNTPIEEFDENLFFGLIENITIKTKELLIFNFKDGTEIEWNID